MDRRAEGRTRGASAVFVFGDGFDEVVRPIHTKAMPVLLTTPGEGDTLLGGSIEEAMAL